MFHRPTKNHVVDFTGIWFPLTPVLLPLKGGQSRFQVGGAGYGVDGRLLDNQASVDQTLEINEAESGIIDQTIDPGDSDHPQVLATAKNCQSTGVEFRGANYLEVILTEQFGGGQVTGPIEYHRAPESGNPVGPVGAVEGLG